MAVMTVSTKPTEPLRSDADLGQVITAVNVLIATLRERERVSPSVPLDAPDPRASIVYTDQEYDALAERLEAPAATDEQLTRTLASRPPRQWWSA
jgi:hypothetical protein